MATMQFWESLSGARKTGLVLGMAGVIALIGGGAYWLLSTDYEPVMRGASPEKVAAAVREIERLKVPYKVSDDGQTVEVAKEDVGRVKVSLAGDVAAGSTGFELFNNTDFSTTEFTQKINYQRALQGELARTISSIEGVSSARVHIVLPESGFLRRKSVSPTAAVTIAMMPGAELTSGQVFGIQKLVAASVPELKIDDITVIDQDGIALSRNKPGEAEAGQRGQMALKREVDTYLEGKLKRLLATLDPQGEFSVSVDATLNASDSKVTTEDVLPVDGGAGKVAGVVVRERQSQRQEATPATPDASASSVTPGSTVREVEYKIGHRVEQIATAPGGIERLSVAVIARAGNLQADTMTLRNLIANAVGAKEADGDTIALVMLPSAGASGKTHDVWTSANEPQETASGPGRKAVAQAKDEVGAAQGRRVLAGLAWALGLVVVLGIAWLAVRRQDNRARTDEPMSDAEVDHIVNRINAWMGKETAHVQH
ncbi:MAG: flagellar basal-body MS-ring/collar protein FliF [Aquabacterium sp.]